MSMSTGDVRRPEVNKLSAKAVAADGKKPDKADEKSPAANKDAPKSAAKAQDSKTPDSKTPGSKTPGSKAPGSKTPASKTPGSKTPGSKTPAGRGPAGKGKSRKPVTPVKVNQGVNWGPVLMFGA